MPLYIEKQGMEALQLTLTPLAAARLQKTLIELMLNGGLDLAAKTWRITVIERDVPCAFLAVEDFKLLFENLFLLEGRGRKLPVIDLQIFVSEEFRSARLSTGEIKKNLPENTDLLIDIAMLQWATGKETHTGCRHFAVIRSARASVSKRFFQTSGLIRYRRIAEKRDDGTYYVAPEAERSLSYFLQTVFRKESFRKGQLAILSKALQRENVIGLLPTGSGKSLTYQLAALLQPGIALVVDPLKSLMKDQYDNLRKNHIDACTYINSSLERKERAEASKKLAGAEVLFVFVSPERLQIRDFRDTLTTMYKRKRYFSYCVIDEVHCISEWGHDFRTAYLKLGENVLKFCRTKNTDTIPLFGLTATASFDVLSDVQRELSGSGGRRLGEDAIIRFETANREELQYEIIQVKAEDIMPGDKKWTIREKIGFSKQERLKKLLDAVPARIAPDNPKAQNFFNEDCTHAGLIFCPHRSGACGVTDKYEHSNKSRGVYDKLEQDKLKIGTFLGAENQKIIEKESLDNQQSFVDNQLNLLIATRAFGMGIDKPNIRFTVHINYPDSIESFVQEAGRAGRDGKPAVCYILFNNQIIKKENEAVEADEDIPCHFHRASFKGPRREKDVVDAFLDRITYPILDRTKIIAEGLLNRLNIDAHLRLWKERLYVDADFQNSYGYIDLADLRIDTNHSAFDKEVSYRVLDFVKLYILREYPGDVSLYLWLQDKILPEAKQGIEGRLAELSAGESLASPIILPFSNGPIEKNETEKAIFRLASVGIIDDYTVDYNSKTYALYAVKKTDEAYKHRLESYLNTYYSAARTREDMRKIDAHEGRTLIRKCLYFLIDFVYKEVAEKRREAIRTMKMACYEGLKENGNQALKEFIDLYFNSKYARKNYQVNGVNRSLTERTKEGKNHDIAWVWEFIEVIDTDNTGSQLDNLKHLLGACRRLLVNNPENACFLLLKSFALFVLEADNEKFLEEAGQCFRKGFSIFRETSVLSGGQCAANILKYKDKLLKYSIAPELRRLIENEIDLLYLNMHVKWLEKFNRAFLEDYE